MYRMMEKTGVPRDLLYYIIYMYRMMEKTEVPRDLLYYIIYR
jgi:hypothetical protein